MKCVTIEIQDLLKKEKKKKKRKRESLLLIFNFVREFKILRLN